jgi:hypothetical protein
MAKLLRLDGSPSPTPSDPAADLWAESIDLATKAADTKKADQLNSAERFAVCLVSGAAIRFDGDILKTANHCKVEDKHGGGFKVSQLTPPPVRETCRVPAQIPPHLAEVILNRLILIRREVDSAIGNDMTLPVYVVEHLDSIVAELEGFLVSGGTANRASC